MPPNMTTTPIAINTNGHQSFIPTTPAKPMINRTAPPIRKPIAGALCCDDEYRMTAMDDKDGADPDYEVWPPCVPNDIVCLRKIQRDP